MASLIEKPVTVVDVTGEGGKRLRIDEYSGGPSTGRPQLSLAAVEGAGGVVEDWQTPEFDEWLLVTEGQLTFESTHAPPVTASADAPTSLKIVLVISVFRYGLRMMLRSRICSTNAYAFW